jgi:hypothetical protein
MVFVHVWVMAYDATKTASSTHSEPNPCHDMGVTVDHHQESTQSKTDCYEMCMSVYDEVSWGFCFLLKEFSDVHRTVFVYQVNSGDTTLKKHFVYNEDPPPVSLIWYARVWKEIKKIE